MVCVYQGRVNITLPITYTGLVVGVTHYRDFSKNSQAFFDNVGLVANSLNNVQIQFWGSQSIKKQIICFGY